MKEIMKITNMTRRCSHRRRPERKKNWDRKYHRIPSNNVLNKKSANNGKQNGKKQKER